MHVVRRQLQCKQPATLRNRHVSRCDENDRTVVSVCLSAKDLAYGKPSLCQDRLGTNATNLDKRNELETRPRFAQGNLSKQTIVAAVRVGDELGVMQGLALAREAVELDPTEGDHRQVGRKRRRQDKTRQDKTRQDSMICNYC
jgi:hypothetical protein